MSNSSEALKGPVVPKEIPATVQQRFEQLQARVNKFNGCPVVLRLLVYSQSKNTKWWLITISTREFADTVLAEIEEEIRTFPKDEGFSFFLSFDLPLNWR